MMTPQDTERINRAIALARQLQQRATELQTPQERRQQSELDRLIHHPDDKVTLVQMTDQAFRSNRPWRSVDQLTHILDVQGIPRFFSPIDRAMLRGFQSFGGYLPGVAVPLVKEKMHHETANVVLPAEPDELGVHLRARRDEGVRMNVNFLGEALLGETEAEQRLKRYLQALQNPDIEVVSVKISTIYSQISPLAREHTLATLSDRLELLYRAASKSRFRRADGRETAKFVYLDMEEYRDLSITADAFIRTLDRPHMKSISAGIALQAYIPDSHRAQKRLTEWAMRRVADGGAPITIRLVKGANMEMERVEASIMGFAQAPFDQKLDTDANYKRMLIYGLQPNHARAVRIGIASHNLFELAYGLILAEENGVMDHVQFEMLEGMANHQRRALFEHTRDLLLYAPACRQEEFITAIGYLIRRLDENTGSDNFLRHAFKLSVDSSDWRQLEQGFREAFDRIETLPGTSRRTQDRRQPPETLLPDDAPWQQFVNEPDTDWALPHHAQWAQSILNHWRDRTLDVPLVIAGQEHIDRPIGKSMDPSRPETCVGQFRIATPQDVEDAVACAKADPDQWRTMTATQRGDALRQTAQRLRERRADLLGIALAEAGKILTESDPEVSEAIDFCEFYARAAESIATTEGLAAQGRGVTVVVPPWNFPIAIPCGGVAAALAAGNTVILKPAPSTVLTAYLLCQCFWDAGISRNVLQFVYGENATEATQLVTHDDVDTVIFTGGTATAFHLLDLKPTLHLLAETGGKNATIVTAMADRDLAIKHVLHSAFGHAGQKCSATSLLILEDEVFEDESFRRSLCDAVESLTVGSAWDLETKVGPMIRPPAGPLEAALKELEPGESWAVMPHRLQNNPNLWSPAVKWNVQPGSATHLTELFGPVLGVMRARNLDEAIALVNATGYGLTSGLQSLDDREQAIWIDGIRAGNLYLNRGTTGAIVLRQPFGGMGRSAFGPGIKAGGPHYVIPLMRLKSIGTPPVAETLDDDHVAGLLTALSAEDDIDDLTFNRIETAARSYTLFMQTEFGLPHDHFKLIGQDNFRKYHPVEHMRIRLAPQDTVFEIMARICAAKIAGCRVRVSAAPQAIPPIFHLLHDLTESWAGSIEFIEEDDDALARCIREGQTDRVRYAAADRIPDVVRRAASETGLYLATDPVMDHGRIELLWYLYEQSLCVDYHRYGNLGGRSGEPRSAIRAPYP